MKFSAPVLFFFAVVYASGVVDAANLLSLDTISDVVINARKLWSKNTVSDLMSADRVPYNTKMAVNYGELNKDTIKTLDADLQIVIAATINLFKKQPVSLFQPKYMDYIQTMKGNPFLTSNGSDHIVHGEYKDFHEFDFNQQLLKKKAYGIIETWIKETLIQDKDALKDLTFSKTDFNNIVAGTLSVIDHFGRYKGLFVNRPYIESKIVDLSVFRFPDSKQHYFKVFRLELFGLKTSSSAINSPYLTSGIRGTFESMIFKPQAVVITNLNPVIRVKAINTAKAMFDE